MDLALDFLGLVFFEVGFFQGLELNDGVTSDWRDLSDDGAKRHQPPI